jgi:hypothetical protein
MLNLNNFVFLYLNKFIAFRLLFDILNFNINNLHKKKQKLHIREVHNKILQILNILSIFFMYIQAFFKTLILK